jgi:hypothetical protein
MEILSKLAIWYKPEGSNSLRHSLNRWTEVDDGKNDNEDDNDYKTRLKT